MSTKKQVSHVNQFTRQVNFCKAIPSGTTLSELQIRLNTIKHLYDEFRQNQEALEEISTDENAQYLEDVRGQIEDFYFLCMSRLTDAINRINLQLQQQRQQLNSGNNGNNQQDIVKIPRIELTPFSGNYEDWTSFKDLFTTLIHSNNNIAAVQKLHYLKNNIVVGSDAFKLIKSISITDANYVVAWKKLTDRYDHKRYIVDSYLKKFFNQPSVKSENFAEIKTLIDTSSEIIDALQIQGIPVNQWDIIIIHVIVSKLDPETHKQWELKLKKDELPKFKELVDFLEARWQSLEMIYNEHGSNTPINNNVEINYGQRRMSTSSMNRRSSFTSMDAKANSQLSNVCHYCLSSNHKLNSCPDYKNLNVEERIIFLKSKRLCFNCINAGHSKQECTSSFKCQICNKDHHTSIHLERNNSSNNPSMDSARSANVSVKGANTDASTNENVLSSNSSISATNSSGKRVLLATAIVYVHTNTGEKIPAKALIDPGSENAVIQEKLAKRLGVVGRPDFSTIIGIGNVPVTTQQTSVTFMVTSCVDESFSIPVEASLMKKITGELPVIPILRKDWPHLKNIKLADMHYDKPSPVEILLGAEAYEQILLDGLIKKKECSPTAQNSSLGWLLFGVVKSKPTIAPSSINHLQKKCLLSTSYDVLDERLRSFWELEEIPEQRKLSVKEQLAENIYREKVHRNKDGRYVVALPFDPENKMEIGESRKSALIALYRMEKRFESNQVLKDRYHNYMKNLLDSGHIELVPSIKMNLPDSQKFYLPHHSVSKEESLTTKLRVVFDASRKSSTGVALNDKLLVGPKTQEDLYSILIRWRKHEFVYIADVEKMYRQVRIIDEHRDYQRILWRFNTTDPILEYRITSVIDGTAASSFLSTRTLKQVAEDNATEYPEASKILAEDFYVDDMSSGSYSVKKAIELQNDLVNILKQSGFLLRKWVSNNKEILENVPVENRQDQSTLVELIEKSIKTLGVYWNQKNDTFEFKITPCSTKHQLTKRELLSDISKLFEPIGWLAPSTIIAKAFMQSLWSIQNLDWDDKVPEDKMQIWRSYRDQLKALEEIKVPRWIGTKEITKIQLHGFGDASNTGYSAVVYARIVDTDGLILVRLLSAKTKVAPVKVISTPKLELCGSVLTARLISKVNDSLKLKSVESFTYSDNTTVLAWLKSHPNHYNIFVANRITEVQNLTNVKNWHFVSTDENPADCASRGVCPSKLKDHHLWWNGPNWLSLPQNEWPSQMQEYSTELEKRKLPINMFFTKNSQEDEYLVQIMEKHSSLSKLLRRTAFVLRYLTSQKGKPIKIIGQPNANELRSALRGWIRYVQSISFPDEVARCRVNDELLSRSKLRSLRPFMDEFGILRVGGRARKSQLAFKAKHPIILPKRNHLTNLIIDEAHILTLHGGPTLMSAFLSNYWIFGRSDRLKRIITSCVICFPYRCKPEQQVMADLPEARVNQNRAFLHSGVDFAGPYTTKTYSGRSRGKHANPTTKSYIAIFVCLVTKAIHIELVSSLGTPAFIACYKRFVARRGKCSDMYSDCGKNFIGSNKELRDQYKKLMKDPELQNYLARDGNTWHFNPPASPSFGGLWESGVKSIKYHLKRLIGNSVFTYEEITTLLDQIEACLNSRPLCQLSDDVNDLSYLTPGHFLIGEAPITVSEISLLDVKVNRLSRWQLLQKIYQQFWKYWSSEYLSSLQQRHKWQKSSENVKPGQLVLLRDENTPPSKWPVAKLLEVFPGSDGKVRVVELEKHKATISPPIPKDLKNYLAKLKTHKSILKRPISKISILPIEDNQTALSLYSSRLN